MRIGVMGVGLVAAMVLSASPSEGATLEGDALEMGEGSIRAYVDVGGDGKPAAIGVVFGESALRGLPPERNRTSRCYDLNGNGRIDEQGECEGDQEFQLDLPRELRNRSDIPFQWVGVNWHPEGHDPTEIWDVPHFDLHFYIADKDVIAGIRVGPCRYFIHCDDRETARLAVPAKYVAEDHIDVDAAVSMMGSHLIDKHSPEFGDPPKPFTHTWILGAYNRQIIFYEPMITIAYLRSRPNSCFPIRQPAAREKAGYYPTEYCIRHHADRQLFTVSLEGLVHRPAD